MSIDAPPLEPLEPVSDRSTWEHEPAAPVPPPQTQAQPAAAARPGRRGLRAAAALVTVALVGGAAGAATATFLDDDPTSRGQSIDRDSASLPSESLDIAAVIAKAEPSVVTISVGFGRGGSGAGTGVILTADGEVLTNAHVVDGASTVRVTLSGESQSRTAEVVGTDASADLALLRIPGATGLPAADLGSSDALQVGDDVVAIGNALGLRGNPTVTRGIVSGLNRSLETDTAVMTGLVQTDASISSGNSGGPLVNAAGEVIGINTAVAASNARTAAENVGFAIAIDRALPVIERLRGNTTDVSTSRAVLGVRISDPTDGSRGALVASVDAGSAAESAGIRAGDLITHVADDVVDGAASLSAAVRAHSAGDKVDVRFVRDGDEQMVSVTLGG